jgi:hypothetical protein
MSLVLINLVILAFIAAGTWWLTGKDLARGGESKRSHHLTRALRCVAVVFLSFVVLHLLEGPLSPADIPLLIIAPTGIAILLRSALSEIFAHGFLRFLDPQIHDHREFDPRQSQRHMDEIARLIQAGRREEAIKLCEALRESGEVTDLLALEHTLEFLGAKQAEGRRLSPLNLAASLRDEGKLPEAETLLLSLLKQKPADEGPALLLMRLYAEDLRQPERAYALLREFARQPHVSSAHVDYARHSIPEWANAGRSATNQPAAPIESVSVGRAAAVPTEPTKPAPFDLAEVDQLLTAGSLGSAVELLEAQIKTQPTDWKLQLKLAEVYAVHCHDMVRAQKITGRLEQNAAFTADHVAMVRAKLEEWQTTAKRHP